jgi:hypothetical protein
MIERSKFATSLESEHERRQNRLLNAIRLPARLTVPDVAILLGFAEKDIPELVKAKMLQPLGKPMRNATKYFAAQHIELCANDPKWLAKATDAIGTYWRVENSKRRQQVALAPADTEERN